MENSIRNLSIAVVIACLLWSATNGKPEETQLSYKSVAKSHILQYVRSLNDSKISPQHKENAQIVVAAGLDWLIGNSNNRIWWTGEFLNRRFQEIINQDYKFYIANISFPQDERLIGNHNVLVLEKLNSSSSFKPVTGRVVLWKNSTYEFDQRWKASINTAIKWWRNRIYKAKCPEKPHRLDFVKCDLVFDQLFLERMRENLELQVTLEYTPVYLKTDYTPEDLLRDIYDETAEQYDIKSHYWFISFPTKFTMRIDIDGVFVRGYAGEFSTVNEEDLDKIKEPADLEDVGSIISNLQ